MSLVEKDIWAVLEDVHLPKTNESVVSAQMVSSVQIVDGRDVICVLEVNPKDGPQLEIVRQKAEEAIARVEGVRQSTAILTAEASNSRAGVRASAASNDPHGMEKKPKLSLNVKKIIAVASGKGGVGKSTVAATFAQKLAENGQLKVGLLDADIYGPSQPKLFGLEGHKPQFNDEKKIVPPEAYGVKVMSIGFMVDAEKALVWRGPMVQSALYQLFRDVQWGTEEEPLDVLIVDMPPGTGDAQLTLAQKVDVDGAIIVSTPQDLALIDARKGIEMFRTVNVPILGLIENMSTHICSNCGHEEPIFGHGGAREEAEKLGVPFLGAVPLSMAVREKADAGEVIDLDLDFDLNAVLA